MANIHQIFSGCICHCRLDFPLLRQKIKPFRCIKINLGYRKLQKHRCHNLLDIFLLQLIAVKRQTFNIVFFFLPAAQFLGFHGIRPGCIHYHYKWLADLFQLTYSHLLCRRKTFPGNLTETAVRCNYKPDSRMITDYFLSADMRCLCKRNRILRPRRLNHPVLIILHMSRRPIHHKANTVDQSYLHLDIIGNMNRNRFFRNKLRFRRHNRPPCRTLRQFIPGLFPFMNIINSRQHHQIHKTFDKSGFSCTYRPYNANIDLAARSHLNISIYAQFIHKNTPSISILQSFHILYERGMPLRRMNYLYQRILSLLSSRQFKELILL